MDAFLTHAVDIINKEIVLAERRISLSALAASEEVKSTSLAFPVAGSRPFIEPNEGKEFIEQDSNILGFNASSRPQPSPRARRYGGYFIGQGPGWKKREI
ncbi:hypothetical protein NDU88_006575 [Pleurodeles waltl]|uniref:Uncharacterized protein n=1 Tax=Pleurodeles waltl TaxID=8319 RepID=A0AAV7QI17_PLEWA|nr:hypothetical protein NDU88_006575 [Pleurodeles waltl]